MGNGKRKQFCSGDHHLIFRCLILVFFLFTLNLGPTAHSVAGDLGQGDAAQTDESMDAADPIDMAPMTISAFYAYADNGQVIIEWETVSENNIIGFHIKRQNPTTGNYKRISKKLLPSFLGTSQGGTYRFVDIKAKPGRTYAYKLVAVSTTGTRKVYGPYTIAVDDPGFDAQLAQDRAYESIDIAGDVINRKAHRKIARTLRKRHKTPKAVQRKGQTGVFVSVKEEGLYRVTAVDIAQAMDTSEDKVSRWIKQRKLSLTYQGLPASWQPMPQGGGLIFYGEGIDSPYTDMNVYRLSRGKARKMGLRKGQGPDAVTMPNGFPAEVHTEVDQWALTGLFDDPNDDYWLWDYLFAGYEAYEQKQFKIDAPGLFASAAGALTIHFRGSSRADHRIVVRLNDTELGETTFNGIEWHRVTLDVPC